MAKKIIYLVMTIMCFLIPFIWLEYETLKNFGVILGFFFGILFGLFLGNFIYSFDKSKSVNFAFVCTLIGIVALVFFFINVLDHKNKLEEEYFKKYGRYTIATIVNGLSEKKIMERQSHSYVDIKFYTKDSQLIYASKEIPSYKFQEHFKYEEIPLVYSEIDPKNILLISTEEEFIKWQKQENGK